MQRGKGFTLIEIVIVMTIIAIALALTAPSIGAGIGRVELNQAGQSVRRYIKTARVESRRFEREQYVILDPSRHSVAVLNESMAIVHEEKLPNSVSVLLDPDTQMAAIYVSPSGAVRGNAVRLRGRSGELEVTVK